MQGTSRDARLGKVYVHCIGSGVLLHSIESSVQIRESVIVRSEVSAAHIAAEAVLKGKLHRLSEGLLVNVFQTRPAL
jgi:hypothetical protein